jgi:hypothetical protein
LTEVTHILSPFSWLHSIQYLLRERFGWERLGRMFDVDKLLPLCMVSGVDLIQRGLTGRTANMRLVAIKPAS